MLSDGSRRTPATPPSSEISSSPGSRANLVLVALIRCCDRNGTLSAKTDLPFLHIDSFPAFQLRLHSRVQHLPSRCMSDLQVSFLTGELKTGMSEATLRETNKIKSEGEEKIK